MDLCERSQGWFHPEGGCLKQFPVTRERHHFATGPATHSGCPPPRIPRAKPPVLPRGWRRLVPAHRLPQSVRRPSYVNHTSVNQTSRVLVHAALPGTTLHHNASEPPARGVLSPGDVARLTGHPPPH